MPNHTSTNQQQQQRQQGPQQQHPTVCMSMASTPTPYWMISLSRSAERSSCGSGGERLRQRRGGRVTWLARAGSS